MDHGTTCTHASQKARRTIIIIVLGKAPRNGKDCGVEARLRVGHQCPVMVIHPRNVTHAFVASNNGTGVGTPMIMSSSAHLRPIPVPASRNWQTPFAHPYHRLSCFHTKRKGNTVTKKS